MLQLIVYSLLIFLTLLALCDLVASCLKKSDDTKKRSVFWTAPCAMLKNRLRGMKTLKEEVDVTEPRPPTVSETV